jgi:hypothetical protein
MKYLSLVISVLFFYTTAFSQLNRPIDKADEHFDNANYLMALPIYKSELKKDPNNGLLKYRLGICFLQTRVNHSQAITYLEECSKNPRADEDVWYYLARAYHLNNKIPEAITTYKMYKTFKPKNIAGIDRRIAQCENAMKLLKIPSNVTFQNLGKEINSDEPDYLPFINKDETVLAFTSRRKDNIGGKKIEIDGYRSSDIYLSTSENGYWTTAKNAGRMINGSLDEQVVGLSADGLEMYVYLDHIDKYGDIYVSNRKDFESEFPKPKIFLPSINEKFESSGCLNEEGNILFFARREKQNEQSDLYFCRKLPNGAWAVPQKLPDNINTPYNEDSPYLSYDSKTLYFASEGHNSIGGYDLFKASWNQEANTFSNPINLGYPINSTDDDRSISVTPDNRLAYVSAFRPNGFGDLDIYRVRFINTEQRTRIYRGRIFLGDTIIKNQPRNYAITLIAANEQEGIEYTFTPNSKSGKYVMGLPAGKYRISISSMRYEDFEEILEVSDIGISATSIQEKNFLLKIKY